MDQEPLSSWQQCFQKPVEQDWEERKYGGTGFEINEFVLSQLIMQEKI